MCRRFDPGSDHFDRDQGEFAVMADSPFVARWLTRSPWDRALEQLAISTDSIQSRDQGIGCRGASSRNEGGG